MANTARTLENPNGRTETMDCADFGMPAWCRKIIQAKDGPSAMPSLNTMADIGDPYTVGHEARVADLASRIARQVGLSEESVVGLGKACRVHDIGKIWISPDILSKPGRLTPAQFETVKQHPVMGDEILRTVGFPSSLREIILQHHERMDGSGYPRGLSGENIRPEARILAVADVVDAMTSPRPHRPELELDAALQEIARGRGTAFDEPAVDACLHLFNRAEDKLLAA